MKRFLKKRWHSIPVALVSALLVLALVTGGAFAVNEAFIQEDQLITQEIVPLPPPTSIDAPDIDLGDLKVGKTYEKGWVEVGTVTIVVRPKDAPTWLHMSLDEVSTSLYGRYAVRLEGPDGIFLEVYVGMGMAYPPTPEVPNWPDKLQDSVQLTESGTYTLTQSVLAIAGSETGSAEVKVTYTLEDS